MEKAVAETKLRILREAIQSNVGVVRSSKVKPQGLPKRAAPLWFWGFLLIAIGAAAADFVVRKQEREEVKKMVGVQLDTLHGIQTQKSLAHLAVPPLVVSKGKDPSSHSAAVDMANPLLPVGSHLLNAATPLSALYQMNRTALPLSVRRIVIDPGHGGKQHGAISESGVSEKDITLDIALRLRRLMENGSLEAFMTREADETLPLEKRVAFANANHADLFVSIHVNWMEPREIRPLETYYVGATNDPAVIKLASIENRDSGYSLSDYRRVLDKIYLDTRREESHRLAKAINSELYHSLSLINPELENRGVKMAPFAVLIGTQMPAVLAEVSCLSNEDDVKLLTNADYREKIAQALLRGIVSYANNLNGSEKKVAELWKKPTKPSASE
ncbi:MAG TPA: N-acetylmuramoyl-L-alanine amidase [Candidatus Binatia bacterium]|nr:N-acetylmuramoyl-L-alanine amidase [Candidatus Binatia bacterium]